MAGPCVRESSGETLACGSTACAIAASLNSYKKGILSSNYVHMQGGKAHVRWKNNTTESMYLIGTAEYIYSGQYKIT